MSYLFSAKKELINMIYISNGKEFLHPLKELGKFAFIASDKGRWSLRSQ